jgi:hypothetical protein
MVIRRLLCYPDANAKFLAGRPTMSKQRVGDGEYTHTTAGIHQPIALHSYRVELAQDLLDEQGQLLEWVIGYAFDTLDAQHLDLRIVAASHSAARVTR